MIPKWGVNPLQQLNNLESREMMNGAGKKKNKVQLHKFVFSLSDPFFIWNVENIKKKPSVRFRGELLTTSKSNDKEPHPGIVFWTQNVS